MQVFTQSKLFCLLKGAQANTQHAALLQSNKTQQSNKAGKKQSQAASAPSANTLDI